MPFFILFGGCIVVGVFGFTRLFIVVIMIFIIEFKLLSFQYIFSQYNDY